MDFLPIFVDLRHRDCLVVGGGEIATRKIALLLQAQANVTVIAPTLNEALKQQCDQEIIAHRQKDFQSEDITGFALVIAATDDTAVNQLVSATAKKLNIPVNVVDNPALCSFIMPAIIDRSPVLVALSSGGTSPVLIRLLRARLETLIPAAYGRLARYAGQLRDKVKQHFIQQPERRRIFWEEMLQGDFAEKVLAGKEQEAKDFLETALSNEEDVVQCGEVYLVGAGPGNPDLLTFRAMHLMQKADVVVYDRLVTPEILNKVRRDATRIYAGKERSKHTLPQESINQLLVRLAKEGKRVLRLKGGDPFIFGRGGEEIETLTDHQVSFEVVPGITAASGVAAYAGIPLTHRDYAQSCIFVAGHLKNNQVDLDWPALARPHQTIVIYMGLVGLPHLCEQLIVHGLSNTTPAAIVQQGTTDQQKIVVGTLDTLAERTVSAQLKAPTLIIVGDVVNLHHKLAWFDQIEDEKT